MDMISLIHSMLTYIHYHISLKYTCRTSNLLPYL
nr:MAG TPA: hypothetical protein [Bacteriophage sp.]